MKKILCFLLILAVNIFCLAYPSLKQAPYGALGGYSASAQKWLPVQFTSTGLMVAVSGVVPSAVKVWGIHTIPPGGAIGYDETNKRYIGWSLDEYGRVILSGISGSGSLPTNTSDLPLLVWDLTGATWEAGETIQSGITVEGTIQVNDKYKFPDSAGTAGQVLAYPSTGLSLEWTDQSGGITGITISVDSGATEEVDTINLLAGTNITLSRSGSDVTVNSADTGITGITLSVDSGATEEVDSLNIIGGTNVTVSRSGSDVTVNSTASGGMSAIGISLEGVSVGSGTTLNFLSDGVSIEASDLGDVIGITLSVDRTVYKIPTALSTETSWGFSAEAGTTFEDSVPLIWMFQTDKTQIIPGHEVSADYDSLYVTVSQSQTNEATIIIELEDTQ